MNNRYNAESPVDSHQVIQFLEDKVYEHNSAMIDQENGYLFSRVVRDKNKNIIAGIAGWTWAHACEITQLWVHEDVRKNGIGKMLLDIAEEEAKRKGCRRILVRSYSFQAPHFYEHHGYNIEHTLNDFPQGHRYYILSKAIG